MEPTAQAVIDAIRFVTMAQKDPDELKKLFDLLLDLAPPTSDNGGFQLLTELAAEGTLTFSLVDE